MEIKDIKKAISWAYHGEELETIKEEIGSVDQQTLEAIVSLLIKLDADYDTVHNWSDNKENTNV